MFHIYFHVVFSPTDTQDLMSFSKGFFFEHLVWGIFARILFRVLLAMSGTPASSNILPLVAPESFRRFLFKEFKSRFETDFLDPRLARIFLLRKGSFKNLFTVTT